MSSFNQPVEIMACEHLAVFGASGADTQAFLQSQLTQDMQTVTPAHAALAGFCTAQGRLLASMLLVSEANGDVLGVARADLMESFLKRLRMFVLRSKVTLQTHPSLKVFGLVMNRADHANVCQALGAALPEADWASVATEFGQLIALPCVDSLALRYQLIATDAQVAAMRLKLGDNAVFNEDAHAWQALDVAAGIGWVQAATQDLFIAQTLNLDLLPGVSFTKGCYPGQEVVARAHYRGTVKRRMHLAHIEGVSDDIAAGVDVFEADEPDNPVGRLISVVPQAEHTLVLFEAPFKVIDKAREQQHSDGGLRAGSASGPALHLKTLPYSLEPAKD